MPGIPFAHNSDNFVTMKRISTGSLGVLTVNDISIVFGVSGP